MTNKENTQISNLNQQISDNFTTQLSHQSVTKSKFQKKEITNIFGIKSTVETTSYSSKQVHELVTFNITKSLVESHKRNGRSGNMFDIDNSKLKEFLSDFEKEVKEQASSVLSKQLKSIENGYLSIIESKSNEWKSKEAYYYSKIEEKESARSSALQELSKKDSENKKLKTALLLLEKKIKKFESDLEHKKEFFFPQSLKIRNQKLLKDKSSSKADYLCEKLEFTEQELFAKKAMLIRLEHDLLMAKDQIDIFKEQEKQSFEFYAKWEVRRKEIEEALAKQVENYNILMAEKLKTTTSLYNSEEKVNELLNELSSATEELQKLQALFEKNKNENEQLKRSNLISKVKLNTVLVVDTTRNFLSNSVGNYITYAETALLGSEINSTSNKAAWTVIAMFSIFSFMLGILKTLNTARKIAKKLFWKKEASNPL